MNDRLLRALHCEKVDYPPVWFKRQAGRFLPSYQQLRSQHTLSELFHCPTLAAQITLMPVAALNVDAAILFSDILVITEALGCSVEFPKDGGIRITQPPTWQDRSIDTLSYVFETIRLVKPMLNVPLIGFCGGPYTVASYLKKTDTVTLQKLTDLSIQYLTLQIQAGVDVLQIFDTWAGYLTPAEFHLQSLPYLRQIIDALKPAGIPIIVFCRGSCRYIKELTSLNPTALSFDWDMPIATLRELVPSSIAIQGNLNPDILRGPLHLLEKEVQHMLASMKNKPGYIFNLGHGVLPDTPVAHAQSVVKWVHSEILTPI